MFSMMKVRDAHHQVAHNNVSKAQAKQKKQYDLKHNVHQVFLAIKCSVGHFIEFLIIVYRIIQLVPWCT